MTDTIFALSSGSPPAAIAVIRVSGSAAESAVRAIAGPLPAPRCAALRTLRNAAGEPLDRALVLRFPGPASATGEDLIELHCHGGRAVVDAVLAALAQTHGLRNALPGEFTRRALENGRIDLSQAEGLADLLEAETEEARIAAFAASEGVVGQRLHGWFSVLQTLRAECEAAIDYAEEGDVDAEAASGAAGAARIAALVDEIEDVLARPSVERLQAGPLIVLAGPPNAGKSSLFNALLERDAAIVTPIAGTTRDILEAGVRRDGRSYRLADTAGLVTDSDDPVERIGVDRARALQRQAALILWLGEAADCPDGAMPIHPRADEPGRGNSPANALSTSIHEPRSIERLWSAIASAAGAHLSTTDPVRLHERQRASLRAVVIDLRHAQSSHDPLLAAEHLRVASSGVAELLGLSATETMLDALFGRFCIGK